MHIHVKVFTGSQEVHTGQLYFSDAISDAVYAQGLYASHTGRDTTNATDTIYANGGLESTLALQQGAGGYVGTLTLGVQV